MPELFDPAEFLIYPDGSAATPRSALGPCSCTGTVFEFAVEVKRNPETGDYRERTTLRCQRCFQGKREANRHPARILGWVDMETHEVTEAA